MMFYYYNIITLTILIIKLKIHFLFLQIIFNVSLNSSGK